MTESRNTWLDDRRVVVAGAVAAAAIVGTTYLGWSRGWFRPTKVLATTAQIMAVEATERAEIVIGPAVRVSATNGSLQHREVVVAADPTDPLRLFAAGIFYPHSDSSIAAVVGYRSTDGGASWQEAFRQTSANEHQMDPSLAYGSDGALSLALMRRDAPDPPDGKTGDHQFRFFRSTDAGATWAVTGTVDGAGLARGQGLDRPFLAVDGTPGTYRGRLHCADLWRYRVSADGGRTFNVHQHGTPGTGTGMNSNPVVLSDGSVVMVSMSWSPNERKRPGLVVHGSSDGGETLKELAQVSGEWNGDAFVTGNFWFMPQIAVDASGGAGRDRLYAVWEDGNGPMRVRVLLARSEDMGRTWIGPTILSEQPADGSAVGVGYSANMPGIAVNKDGVVAVTWYDRRGLPDVRGPLTDHQFGAGCNVRMRVSLDGGKTWQPSVQLNQVPIKASVWQLRDTTGLAADNDGVFHPMWIDDQTGVLQVWTAGVKVEKK